MNKERLIIQADQWEEEQKLMKEILAEEDKLNTNKIIVRPGENRIFEDFPPFKICVNESESTTQPTPAESYLGAWTGT